MTYYQLAIYLNLIISIICLLIIIYILFKNPGNKINIIFSLLSLCFVNANLSNFFIDFSKNYSTVLFWSKAAALTGIFGPPLLLYFSKIFPVKINTTKIEKILLFLMLVLIIFIPTSYNVNSITIFKDAPTQLTFGGLYSLIALSVIISLIISLKNFIRSYRIYRGIKKMQVLYLVTGLTASIVILLITNVVLPIFGFDGLASIGPSSSIIFILLTAYAIAKYHFLDIKIIIQRSVFYALFLAIIYAIYSSFIIAVGFFYAQITNTTYSIIAAFSAVLAVALYRPIEKYYQNITDRYFFKKPYYFNEVVKELNSTISNNITNLDNLINGISELVVSSFKVNTCLILTPIDYGSGFKVYKTLNSKLGINKVNLSGGSALVKYFKKEGSKAIIISDEIENRLEQNTLNAKNLSILEKQKLSLKELGAQMCAPMFGRSGLSSILCVGEKLSGEPFYIPDIELINVITQQLGVAVENATLYKDLEKRVQDRTLQLQKANENLRKINRRLKEISEAKSEFVSIASHQLRSPLSIVKGALSFLVSGEFGQLNKEQKDLAEKSFINIDKLIRLINDILNITRIEFGRMAFKLEKTNFCQLTKDTLKIYLPEIKNRKLKLTTSHPKDSDCVVNIDKELVSQVISNLIDNAIKYTAEGEINVKAEITEGFIRFSIKDTGIGIEHKDMDRLFSRFIRGKSGRKMFIGGTGLGLYFVKRVIEAHGGRVWAESQGLSKGSTFYFTLPLE